MFMAQEPQIPSRQDLRITIPLPVLPSKHECGVLLVLDLEQSVEDHRAATTEFRSRSGKILIEVDHVLLVVRLDILGRVVAEKAEELVRRLLVMPTR